MTQRSFACPNCGAQVVVPLDYFHARIYCHQCHAVLDRRTGELAGAAPPQYTQPQPPQYGVPYPVQYGPSQGYAPYPQPKKRRWWLIPLIAVPIMMVVGILGLAAIPLITSGGFSSTGEWHTYTDTAGGYQIDFPRIPSTKTQQIPTALGQRTLYSSYIQRGIFHIECSYYDLGSGPYEDYEVDYAAGANGMAESKNGRVVSIDPHMVGHLSGSLALIKAHGRYSTGLMVRHGNRLHIVVVENHTERQQDIVDRFLSSFKLIDEHGIELADPMKAWRTVGNNWTIRTTVDVDGAEPVVSTTLTEIIDISGNEVTHSLTVTGMGSINTMEGILYLEQTSQDDRNQYDEVSRETITTEAGTFDCDKKVYEYSTEWVCRETGLLVLMEPRGSGSTTRVELIEVNVR